MSDGGAVSKATEDKGVASQEEQSREVAGAAAGRMRLEGGVVYMKMLAAWRRRRMMGEAEHAAGKTRLVAADSDGTTTTEAVDPEGMTTMEVVDPEGMM